ncbi:MAG TPA: hypothetical protein VF092_01935 [Longimicrobium sp.]
MRCFACARLAWVAAALVYAPAAAQQTPRQLSAPSSFRLLPRTEECSFGYATTGVRYTVVGAAAVESPEWPHLLLEEKTSIQRCESQEGPAEAEVSVVARPAAHPEARPLWIVRRRGEDGALVDSFPGYALYRITEYGCCGSENVDAYYSLLNGRALFTADHPLLLVDVKPFGTGFVAVHDANAAESPGAQDDRTLVAVVAFGAPGGAIQRAAVRNPSNDVYLKRLELVARNAAGHVKTAQMLNEGSEIDARWTVSISMEWGEMSSDATAGTVTIPIENGRMVIERARAASPFRVVAMPAR